MEPRELVRALRTRFWLIVILVVIGSLTAAAVSFFQSPVYRVEIVMAATAPKNPTTKLPDPTIALAYQANMASIASASESIDVAKATHERLQKSKIEIPAEKLLGMMSANPVANSNSLKILVSDSSPFRVVEIANAWGAEAATLLSTDPVMLGGELRLTNKAVPPKKPVKPKPSLYLALGAFAGLVVGLSLALGLEFLDPRFHTPSRIEEELGVPLLATLDDSGDPASVEESYSRLRASIVLGNGEHARSIAVMQACRPDKGVPSVQAAMLAKSIAASGRRTLLVDCDLEERQVSDLMRAPGRPGLSEVMSNGGKLDGTIVGTSMKELSFLGAGNPENGESSDLLSRKELAEVVVSATGSYDFVILAAAPASGCVDGPAVAAVAGETVVFVDAQRCTRLKAAEVVGSLERMGARITGVVLENMKSKTLLQRLLARH